MIFPELDSQVPDFRMMAVKPIASVKDSVLYTCSAAVNSTGVSIQFLINFKNLTQFCGTAPRNRHCRSPHVFRRKTIVIPPLVLLDSKVRLPVHSRCLCGGRETNKGKKEYLQFETQHGKRLMCRSAGIGSGLVPFLVPALQALSGTWAGFWLFT